MSPNLKEYNASFLGGKKINISNIKVGIRKKNIPRQCLGHFKVLHAQEIKQTVARFIEKVKQQQQNRRGKEGGHRRKSSLW